MTRLSVVCVQLDPVLGQVKSNMERASCLLLGWLNRSLPLQKLPRFVILPELAFTGYKFHNRQHIEPFLERAGQGPTFKWAQETCKKYECHTLVGYPEIVPESKTIYNSAMLVSPKGELLYNYRKTFLYETDEEWGCSESDDRSFPCVDVEINEDASSGSSQKLKLRLQIGICMDLNPYKFEAPFTDFEFASKAYQQDVDLMLCPMAWLSSESPNIKTPERIITEYHRKQLEKPANPDGSTQNYWALRNYPFLDEPLKKPVGFVACNRSGWDENVHYAGSTSVLRFSAKDESDEKPVTLLGGLNQDEENVLACELSLRLAPAAEI